MVAKSLCWCFDKDLREDRRLGMEQESLLKKVIYSIFFGCSTLEFLVMGAIWAARSANADNIGYKIYDTCAIPFYTPDPELS